MKNPIVIAEIGCNHKGDMEIAHRMIKLLGVLKELVLASGENNLHESGEIKQKKSKEKSHYQF